MEPSEAVVEEAVEEMGAKLSLHLEVSKEVLLVVELDMEMEAL
jgi:hypothetical protein